MKKLTIAALITLGLGGVTYAAMAQQNRGAPPPNIEKMDTNADGAISKDEIDANRAERFYEADVNGDNLVSPEEFATFSEAERERRMQERQERRFSRLDSDGDGLITAEEHAAAADERVDRMFARMDTDSDGVISEAEREAAREMMSERRGKRGKGRRG